MQGNYKTTIEGIKYALKRAPVACVRACEAVMLGWLPWNCGKPTEFSRMGITETDAGTKYRILKSDSSDTYLFFDGYIYVIKTSLLNTHFNATFNQNIPKSA